MTLQANIEKYNKLIPNRIQNLSDQIEKARFEAGIEAFQKYLPAGIGPFVYEGAKKDAAYTAVYRHNDETFENEIIMLLDNRSQGFGDGRDRIIIILRNRHTGNEIAVNTISHQNEFLLIEESWSKKFWS